MSAATIIEFRVVAPNSERARHCCEVQAYEDAPEFPANLTADLRGMFGGEPTAEEHGWYRDAFGRAMAEEHTDCRYCGSREEVGEDSGICFECAMEGGNR